MGQRPKRARLALVHPGMSDYPADWRPPAGCPHPGSSSDPLPPALPSATAPCDKGTEISTPSRPYAGTGHMLGAGYATPAGAGELRSAHPLGRLSAAPRTRSPSVLGGANTPACGCATPSSPGRVLSLTCTPLPMIEGGPSGARVRFFAPQPPHTHRPTHSLAADVHSPHYPWEPPRGPAPTNEPPQTESHSTVKLFAGDLAVDTGTPPPGTPPPGRHILPPLPAL